MECAGCGADLDFREAFCSRCGEVTRRGKSASELAGRSLATILHGIGTLASVTVSYAKNPDNRIKVGLGATAALLLLIAFTSNPISALFGAAPPSPAINEDGTPNFAEYEDVFLADQAAYVVTGPANVRDYPTGQGTSVIGNLSEGETVNAREVQAFDPLSQWLKLASGGYVWAANLEPIGEGPEPAGSVFPNDFRGRWSTRDSCDGNGPDIEVEIDPKTHFVQDNPASLVNTYEDGRGDTVYVIRPSASPSATIEFTLRFSANGRWIVMTHIDPNELGTWDLHDPGLRCDLLYR